MAENWGKHTSRWFIKAADLKDRAKAGSGRYEGYHIDPFTGAMYTYVEHGGRRRVTIPKVTCLEVSRDPHLPVRDFHGKPFASDLEALEHVEIYGLDEGKPRLPEGAKKQGDYHGKKSVQKRAQQPA